MTHDAYKKLIRDTISLLKEESGHLFVSKESLPLLKTSPSKETPKPAPKKIAPPPAAVLPPPLPLSTPKTAAKVAAPTPAPVSVVPPLPSARSLRIPELKFSEKIPDDAEATRLSERWKNYLIPAEVVLLTLDEKEEDLLFFKNLAKAIHTKLCPAKILDVSRIEKEKKWSAFFQINTFKLVLIQESSLMKTADLKSLYTPASPISPPTLGGAPLILLTPELKSDKKALWNHACRLTSSPQ